MTPLGSDRPGMLIQQRFETLPRRLRRMADIVARRADRIDHLLLEAETAGAGLAAAAMSVERPSFRGTERCSVQIPRQALGNPLAGGPFAVIKGGLWRIYGAHRGVSF